MKKLLLLLFTIVMATSGMIAQKMVHGTVTDDSGSPLIGASVVVKDNPNVGTITDIDGKFQLKVDANAKALVISYIGYTTQEVEIGASDEINVTLTSGVQLEDVVVTALGVSREKKSLGYATQEVKGDNLNKVPKDNIVNTLSGKVAGVQVKNNTNMGGSSNIVIRGFKSLTGNNQALFVVDGVPVNNSTGNSGAQQSGRSGYDYGNAASDINPDDIESVNILKGAAATALYGSRAANGVVMITTKKGSKGKGIGLDYTASFTVGTIDKSTFPEYQKEYGAGYGPYYSNSEIPQLGQAVINGETVWVTPFTEDASFGAKFDPNLMVYQWDAFDPSSPDFGKPRPWLAGANGPITFFNNSNTLKNSFAFNGSTDKSTYRLSYTRFDMTGIMPNSSLKKNNVNLTASYDVTSKFTVSAMANYINTAGKGRNHTGYSDNILSSFRQWFQMNVDLQRQKDAYDRTHENVTWNRLDVDNPDPIYWDNPYWQRYENYQTDGRNRLLGFVKGDWNIMEGLDFMARYAVDSYTELREERKAIGSVAGALGIGRPDVRSGYGRYNRSFTESNFDMMLTFKRDLTTDLNLYAMIGSNIRRTNFQSIYASTNGGLIINRLYALSNSKSTLLPPLESKTTVGVNGIFGQVSLGYKNFLYLDGTMRRDESSTLPAEARVYYYPSVSTSLVFSELMNADWLDNGKLRLNYAEVGADAPWGATSDTYSSNPLFNGNPLYSLPYTKQNPDLKPERTKSLEFGLEMNMFKNKLGLDLSLYKMNTVDQIMPVDVSFATGFGRKYFNAGEIENKGLEVVLRLMPVSTPSFKWNIDFNWAKNINTVVALYDDPETGIKIENLTLATLQGGVSINARIGEPYGTIQGRDFVYENGQKVVLPNGYYARTSTSDQVIGNINPDWNAGINNTFSFNDFSFGFLIDWQQGGSVFSLDQWYGQGTGLYAETAGTNDLGNPLRDDVIKNDDGTYDPASGGVVQEGVMETEDGTFVTNTIRAYAGYYGGAYGWARNPNARYVYDASYIKLRELTLSYNLPGKFLGNGFVKGATLSFVGGNLWILKKNLPHADPEASQGAGNIQGWQSGVMPALKTYGFNLKLHF